ncbi:zinc-binding dehydrogenase [Flavisphingomonas formosensis]|uniref:zinc-binding dehydrogenase n=1 Tax=Flavisphingomonas formosensis TaxID=861534 RepID=UPI0012FAD1B7|nr:zinc-binding dehydrogenase [Sphingomonas formosensis]
MAAERHGLELHSLVTEEGTLRITLDPVPLAEPGPGELLVRVEAAPVNPSDLGLLFGPADMATLRREGDALIADVPLDRLPAVAGRIGKPMAVGNEGAGTVVAAGPDLQHLIGRKVGMIGGSMYAQYRRVALADSLLLPEDAAAAEGASLFVNPLTALGFVETMRAEGHSAIVHTAAASNLGQMLVRICKADGVPLVNIVRSPAQVALLRDLGAEHVLDSSSPDFDAQLVEAIAATGATIAFDAIGGGTQGGRILAAMEAVAARSLKSYSRYGSDSFKQLYIYGMLDVGPTVIDRHFGFAWSMGGWLLFPFLRKAGAETVARMRARILAEFRTTFASTYTATIGLADLLDPEVALASQRKGTGEKYLVDPSR